MKNFIQEIKDNSRQEKLLILLSLSIFMPFYFTAVIILVFCLYALCNKQLQEAYRHINGSKWVLPFTALSIIVSIIYKNYVGVACSLVVLTLLSIAIYYGYYSNKKVLKQILKIYLFMSVVCGLYALVQYNQILANHNIEGWKFIIFDKAKDRVQSFFFNANYYAMMCEFFALITVYFFLYEKKEHWLWKVFYVVIGVYNLFFLLMTACRMAWPALGLGVIALCLLTKDKKYYILISSLVIAVIAALIVKPDLFPRIDNVGPYFSRRLRIFDVAIQNIKKHPLFGEGPLTYYHVHLNYTKPIKTQHAHNFILDPLMNYGIVGVSLIVPFFIERMKSFKRLAKNSLEKPLIVAFVITVIIHGLLDFTVYFVPTGFFFFMVLLSSEYEIKEANN